MSDPTMILPKKMAHDSGMSAADARAYIDRWKAVAEIEQRELQSATIKENWRRINAIKQRAARLGIARVDDDGEMDVFLLWARLRVQYAPN